MKQIAIVHYDEIGIKGGNRDFFEKKLVSNIKERTTQADLKDKLKIKRTFGRFFILLKKLTAHEKEKLTEILSTTFGIANFSFGVSSDLDLEKIAQAAIEQAHGKEFDNFRVKTTRSNKKYPMISQEIDREVGGQVQEEFGIEVKLKKPDLTIFVEILDKEAFVYAGKIQGPGGMPTGVAGRALVLLSGGIDSPVAAWYMAKRGLKLDFLHFHSYPFTTESSIEKVKELVNDLGKYDIQGKLHLCPFGNLQKKILAETPEKLRVILYRRFMFRIAEKLAHKTKAQALITGEALGQVASQTIENITRTNEVVTIPILQPLIGFDKKEIIEKSRAIGVYQTSTLPHDDCCTLFVPKNPATRARKDEVEKAEEIFDVDALIAECLGEVEVV